ncbi:hypothetical protein HMPREF1573_01291, partial [Gardnerella vaginalis JCP7276]
KTIEKSTFHTHYTRNTPTPTQRFTLPISYPAFVYVFGDFGNKFGIKETKKQEPR